MQGDWEWFCDLPPSFVVTVMLNCNPAPFWSIYTFLRMLRIIPQGKWAALLKRTASSEKGRPYRRGLSQQKREGPTGEGCPNWKGTALLKRAAPTKRGGPTEEGCPNRKGAVLPKRAAPTEKGQHYWGRLPQAQMHPELHAICGSFRVTMCRCWRFFKR